VHTVAPERMAPDPGHRRKVAPEIFAAYPSFAALEPPLCVREEVVYSNGQKY
jgi:hypothetical protein